jgi:hypothetical protein
VLVYGDHSEIAAPRERLRSLREQLGAIAVAAPGIERHAKLAGALIEAGQLLQGIADADFAKAGADRRTPTTDLLAAFVQELSRALYRSWDSGFAAVGELPVVPELRALPNDVELRTPEGFAFYSVYPEAYAAAARKLRLAAPPRVIGLRSIGTTLAAVVAAALDAPPPITLRPFGDPFRRQVALAPELSRELLDGEFHYVIVDEGPGQSGSSFGAVADWLHARSVPLDRIAFLPSHGGDLGPQASEHHRQRWRKAQRVAAGFDQHWLANLFGPLAEFSTGNPLERRKYFAWHNGERLLLKFAGLGAIGERKFAMARALYAERVTPEPLALVYGFLVERWVEDARPLDTADRPVEEIGRYIGARARMFPAADGSGAALGELVAMIRRNAPTVLGGDAMRRIEGALASADALSRRVTRVRTDNKLDRGEWLRTSGGRLLKTDAVDHHQGHDLIGCQDMAWDVAGAIVEFGLHPGEARRLIDATRFAVDPELLAFCELAYCSFRVGQAALAPGVGADRYVERLGELLQHDCHGTRHESSVG